MNNVLQVKHIFHFQSHIINHTHAHTHTRTHTHTNIHTNTHKMKMRQNPSSIYYRTPLHRSRRYRFTRVQSVLIKTENKE